MAGERVTADQLKGMSDEDILKLDTNTLSMPAAPAGEGGDGKGNKEGDAAGAGGADAAGAGGGGDGDEEHGLTAEQLEALAKGEDVNDASGKPKYVPHSRFNEVNEEKKAAQTESQTLREQLAAVNAQLDVLKKGGKLPEEQPDAAAAAKTKEADDAKAADEKYRTDRLALLKSQQEAILEGDVDKAASVAAQLEAQAEERNQRRLDDAIKRTREETAAEVRTALTVSQMQTRAETEAKTVFAAYPFLDNNNPKADADAINLVVLKRDAMIASGKDPVEAMLEAAKEVGEKFKPLHAAAAPAPAPADDAAAKKKAEEEARAAALAKGAKVNEQQANTGGNVGAGNRSNTEEEITFEQFSKMTDDQIAKLPDHVIRRLDGSTRKPA